MCRVPRFRVARAAALVVVPLVVGLVGCGGDGGAGADEAPAAAEPEEFKVTVAGDSISVGLGASLREAVDDEVVTKVIGVEGSGLARPDVFDWPGRLEELARDFPPEVLILSLASNDAQDLTDADGDVVASYADEEAWDEEYRRRLAALVDPFEATGTTVVWVGHVRTADQQVGETNRRVHRLATEVAAERDWVEAEDLGELLGTGEDRADRCLVDDGLHLTVECLDEGAAALVPRLPGPDAG